MLTFVGQFPLCLCNWLTWEFEGCLGAGNLDKGSCKNKWLITVGRGNLMPPGYNTSSLASKARFNQVCCLHPVSISSSGVTLLLGFEIGQLQWLELPFSCTVLCWALTVNFTVWSIPTLIGIFIHSLNVLICPSGYSQTYWPESQSGKLTQLCGVSQYNALTFISKEDWLFLSS